MSKKTCPALTKRQRKRLLKKEKAIKHREDATRRRASQDREDATRRQNDRDRRQKPTERAREQKQTEKKIDADFIIRGLRNPADFEFEKSIAHNNRKLSGIETVFLITAAETSYICSSIVREIILNKGDYSELVPSGVKI